MELGAFSVSLAVRDLQASRDFYESLGFASMGGDAAQGWLIMRNGPSVIGLFQGMFERNILTFNPGWHQDATARDAFADVREIQAALDARGIAITTRADPDGTGPAHIVLSDPDGNVVMLDQHVPRPAAHPAGGGA